MLHKNFMILGGVKNFSMTSFPVHFRFYEDWKFFIKKFLLHHRIPREIIGGVSSNIFVLRSHLVVVIDVLDPFCQLTGRKKAQLLNLILTIIVMTWIFSYTVSYTAYLGSIEIILFKTLRP